MQRFRILPFSTPDRFELLPSIAVQIVKCGHPSCHRAHGFAAAVQWGAWGICAEITF